MKKSSLYDKTIPLDQWVGENALSLGAQLAVHLSEFNLQPLDKEMLLRFLLISIREWSNEKESNEKKTK